MTDNDLCPPDRCYGCWEHDPHQGGHEADLMDMRTGRRWCHEHMAAIISWELEAGINGDRDDPSLPYAEWVTS